MYASNCRPCPGVTTLSRKQTATEDRLHESILHRQLAPGLLNPTHTGLWCLRTELEKGGCSAKRIIAQILFGV